jgi:hypothetical protein
MPAWVTASQFLCPLISNSYSFVDEKSYSNSDNECQNVETEQSCRSVDLARDIFTSVGIA